MSVRKPINLSWLVEKWTLIDEDSYLKNMWINQEIQTPEDIEKNYIDIDQDVENFVLLPTADELDEHELREAFIASLDKHQRDNFLDNYDGIDPREEFLDIVYEQGLESEWNSFRDKAAADILLTWALGESIPINKDMETININKL